jgi:signal transduction histidine kinase
VGIGKSAHDLRNSLGVMRGSSQMLLSSHDADTRYYAGLIFEETTYLSQLAQDLGDFARIEAGDLELSWSAIDLGALVRESSAASEEQGLSAGLVSVTETGPGLASGDVDRLDQVLRNLLANATLRSPTPCPIEITVGLQGHGQHSEVVLRIEDHGPAVPQPILEQLFDPFALTYPVTRRGRYTGLGLAIAKGIVERHGGQIWADSEPSGGLAVSFSLPVERVQARPTIPSEELRR